MANANITLIPAPRVPIVDLQTGLVSTQWFRYFYNLYYLTGQGTGLLPTTSGGTGLGTYAVGDMLYFNNGFKFNKLAIGLPNYVMTSNGTSPVWSDPDTITVKTAKNLAGGLAGEIPFQSAPNSTTFSTGLRFNSSTEVLTAKGGIGGGQF